MWGKKGIQEFVVTWLKWFWLVEVLAFGAYVFHLVLRVSCFCLVFFWFWDGRRLLIINIIAIELSFKKMGLQAIGKEVQNKWNVNLT